MLPSLFPCILDLTILNDNGEFFVEKSYKIITKYELNKKVTMLKNIYALHNRYYQIHIRKESKVADLIRENSDMDIDIFIERDIYRNKI
jgi:hypothetical protein